MSVGGEGFSGDDFGGEGFFGDDFGGEGFSGDGLCSKHQAENGSFEPGGF